MEEEAGEKARVDALTDVGQTFAEMLARQEGDQDVDDDDAGDAGALRGAALPEQRLRAGGGATYSLHAPGRVCGVLERVRTREEVGQMLPGGEDDQIRRAEEQP